MSRLSDRRKIQQLKQENQAMKDQQFDFFERQFYRKINKDKTGGKYNEFNMEYGSKQIHVIIEKIQKIRENDKKISPFPVGIYDYYYLCTEEIKQFVSLSKAAKFYSKRGQLIAGTVSSIEYLDNIIVDEPDCDIFDIFIAYQDYFRVEVIQKQNNILRATLRQIKKCKKQKTALPTFPVIPSFEEKIPHSVTFVNDIFIAIDFRSSNHMKYGNVKCIINAAKYNIDNDEITDDVNLIDQIIQIDDKQVIAQELASHKLFDIERPQKLDRLEPSALEQEKSKQIKLTQQIRGLLEGTYPLYLTNLMISKWTPITHKRKKR